ncbi:hypothetical protein [Nocardiopsis sp. LOL_012]|uniref:hypothetical protein n=1 Tax=Nocardiopsis sp. LOL_012 TaxID=3345409 RepID=UPI003A870012
MKELVSLVSEETLTPAVVQARQLLRGPLRPAAEAHHGQAPLWMGITDQVEAAARSWLATPTWSDSQAHLEQHQDALHAPIMREQLRELATTSRQVGLHLQILDLAQERGTENAYLPLVLGEHLPQWLATPDWEASEQYLTTHADLLLRPEALTLLTEQDKQGQEGSATIAVHTAILTIARARSVQEAYRLIRDAGLAREQAEAALPEGDTDYLNAAAILAGSVHGDTLTALLYLALSRALGDTDDSEELIDALRAAAHEADATARERAIAVVTETITAHPAQAVRLVKLLTALSSTAPR